MSGLTGVKEKKKGPYPYIAVRVGHVPGIYTSWTLAQPQVVGFKGNNYKGYHSYQEALQNLQSCGIADPQLFTAKKSDPLQSPPESPRPTEQPRDNTPTSECSSSSEMNSSTIDDPDITLKKQCYLDNISNSCNDKMNSTYVSPYLLARSRSFRSIAPMQPHKILTDSCTQTDMNLSSMDEMLERLDDKENIVETLSHELDHVKQQIKNEIKSYCNDKDNDLEEINKSLTDIVKINTKVENRSSDLKKDLDNLRKNVHSMFNDMKEMYSELKKEFEDKFISKSKQIHSDLMSSNQIHSDRMSEHESLKQKHSENKPPVDRETNKERLYTDDPESSVDRETTKKKNSIQTA